MDASSRSKDTIPPIVRALDDIIVAVHAIGLQETGNLLRVARLDLLMRVHGIEAEELELLTRALTQNTQTSQKQPKRAAQRRHIRDKKKTQLRR